MSSTSIERSDAIKLQNWGITILRLAIGVIFLAHGAQKLFIYGFAGTSGFFAQIGVPMPALTAVFAMIVEFLGGLALIFGLFTRPAALLLAINMIGAMLTVHLKGGFFLPTGIEYTVALLAANTALMLTGAGDLAIDNLWQRRDNTIKNQHHIHAVSA